MQAQGAQGAAQMAGIGPTNHATANANLALQDSLGHTQPSTEQPAIMAAPSGAAAGADK